MGKRPFRIGDNVMIVRGAPRYLGRTGTIVSRTADALRGDESDWESKCILARDWVVELACGPMAWDRADGSVVVTAYLCSLERCLMRLDADETAEHVEECELIGGER